MFACRSIQAAVHNEQQCSAEWPSEERLAGTHPATKNFFRETTQRKRAPVMLWR
jgi:hypothetical protein